MKQPGTRIASIIVALFLMAGMCACGQNGSGSEGSGDEVAIDLQQGENQALDIDGLGKDVKWKSKDKSIATIDKNGHVIAGKPGETEIVVRSGNKTWRYRVRVEDKKKSTAKKSDTKKSNTKASENKNGTKSDSEKQQEKKTQTEQKVTAAQEDTRPAILVDKVSAKPGEQGVTLPVRIKNNPGVLGMLLTIQYDDQALLLRSASNGNALKNVLTLTKPGTLENGARFLWDGMEITDDQIRDGTILKLNFDIAPGAKTGEYIVSFAYDEGDIIDKDLASVKMVITGGSIKVK